MDFSQIKAFLAVAEHGSFTKAAKSLHLSQPSISLKVIALEKHLKIKLFNREKSKIYLSEAGHYTQKKLRHILNEIDKLECHFINQDQLNRRTYTIYHEPDIRTSSLRQLLVHIESIHDNDIVINTFKCKSSQHVIDLLTKDFNSYGLSKYRYECDGIRSRLLTHEEFMLLCAGEPSNKKPSIDLCDLLSKKIFLPELHSESLRLLEARIRPFGLDISDFKKRSHVSEALMPELIKDSDMIGIRLCNINEKSTDNRIRINELTTPYGLYLLANQTAQAKESKDSDVIFNSGLNYQGMENYPPVLTRNFETSHRYSVPPVTGKYTESRQLRIGIQNRTIQTVISGRAIQKLGLLDSFMAELSDSSRKQFTTRWIDHNSAAPILKGLKESELDIAIIGDYAISHMATSQQYNDTNGSILISFVSINPYGSGSSLLVHKDIKETGLQNLENKSIAVPFLSTAHGSLLYNLNQKNILGSTRLVNINLDNQTNPIDESIRTGAVACFTPFDHFISAKHRFQKIEDEVSTPFAFYGVVVRQEFAIQQPDIVIAFLKAMLCSNYWFRNTTSCIEHLSRWTGVSKSYINYILGERHGKDGHYQPDMTIREDWVKEYTEKIFIENQNNKSRHLKKEPVVQTEYLKSAMRELGMTRF